MNFEINIFRIGAKDQIHIQKAEFVFFSINQKGELIFVLFPLMSTLITTKESKNFGLTKDTHI